MMHRLFTALVFSLCTHLAVSQNLLCTEVLVVDFHFTNSNGVLNIDVVSSPDSGSYLQLKSLLMQGTDLHIKYQAVRQKDGFECKVELSVRKNDAINVAPANIDLIGDRSRSADGGYGELIWRDFFEDHGSMTAEYKLLIKADLFGETHVRCDEQLVHPFSRTVEKAILITGMTAGAGMLGAGQISRISANKNQRAYRDNWLNGESLSNSQDLNVSAQNQKKNYRTLTIAGGATILATGLYWWLRERHFRKDRKEFEKYCDCQKLLAFAPLLETPSFSEYAAVGITMKIRIK